MPPVPKIRNLMAIASMLALPICSGMAQAATVTLTNGSMETFSIVSAADDPNNTYASSTPTGWSLITPGGEALYDYGSKRPDGGNFWSLQYVNGWINSNGTANRYNAGGIYQTVTGLTVGTTYAISFYSMGDHVNDPKTTEHWDVKFGSATLSGSTVDAANPTWVQDTLNFVATSTSQVLTFKGVWVGATPGATPEILNLDGISITAVPEPSSGQLALAGLTLGGFVFARRRKTAR